MKDTVSQCVSLLDQGCSIRVAPAKYRVRPSCSLGIHSLSIDQVQRRCSVCAIPTRPRAQADGWQAMAELMGASCAEARIQQQMTSMLYGFAPRESRRARERAQEATSYGDYVQRSAGELLPACELRLTDDMPNARGSTQACSRGSHCD